MALQDVVVVASPWVARENITPRSVHRPPATPLRTRTQNASILGFAAQTGTVFELQLPFVHAAPTSCEGYFSWARARAHARRLKLRCNTNNNKELL